MQAKIVIVRGEAEHYYSFLPALRVQLIQILQQPILLQINLTCFSVTWCAIVKRCGDLTCATETKYYKRWQQCTGVVSMCSGCVFEMPLPDSIANN